MFCEDLEITPTVGINFSIYTTRPEKGSWVSLRGMSMNAPFTSHSNEYKNWRDEFTRVRGQEGFLGVSEVDSALIFPLVWNNDLMAITRYEKNTLPLRGQGLFAS